MKFLVLYTSILHDVDFNYPDITDCLLDGKDEDDVVSKFHLSYPSSSTVTYKIDRILPVRVFDDRCESSYEVFLSN